ncbi:MAG: ABC transporter substrate-binding protein, partial [Kibdelosporangium sp.]
MTFTGQSTVFDGADQIVELLRVLVRRPRLGEAPERKPRKGIPIVCLIRDNRERELLAELGRRLGRIPHARYIYSAANIPVRDVLASIASDLAGRGGPKFPRFGLVYRLTGSSGRDANVSGANWLLRQPYLAPGDPGTLAGFAERLTVHNQPVEDPEQLLRLLVNAFLADLRHAYRRRAWRPGAARRTSYPVVLLDGATSANGGYRLLQLINDVRTDTGAFDPVVFLSAGTQAPSAQSSVPSARDALAAYRKWSSGFASASRSRVPGAWLLTIKVPPSPNVESDRYDEARERLLDARPIVPDPAPLWSRRWALVAAVVLLASIVVAVEESHRRSHCGLFFTQAESDTLVTVGNNQCVGVTARGFAFQPGLGAELAKVGELNRRAEQAHEDNPRRPYVSLLMVESEKDSLAGVAAAQDRQIARSGDDDPLLRILVAHGGPEVLQVVRAIVAADTTIVGAVGFDRPAPATMEALSRLGLPMIAAAETPAGSELYYRFPPQDRRETAIAARYAADRFPARKVLVVAADQLRADATKSFQDLGFQVAHATPAES